VLVFWTAEIRRLTLVAVPAGIAGYLLGAAGWFVAAAVLALLVWHLLQLRSLLRWLRLGNSATPAHALGPWKEVKAGITRLRARSKKRKKRLARMLSRFQRSSEALPYGTLILSADGSIESFNRAAARLLGLSVRVDRGRRITNLVRHPDFVRYMRGQEWDEAVEIPSPRDDEGSLSVRAVKFGGKQVLLSVRDTTRSRHLETMRRDFVANVSHELRTPLTVLRGYLELLESDDGIAGSADRLESILQMDEQTQRMQRIVEDLLTLAKLESGVHGERPDTPVPVPGLISDVVGEGKVLAGSERFRFSVDVDETLWLTGNAKELYSVFMNLVHNAVRYSPGGSEIAVRWQADEEGAYFVVSDRGIGIEPRHLDRLTERFYRVDKGRSRASGGTGLGLAIVKHALQRHDADLNIRSHPGQGSVFTCHFPVERVVRKQQLSRVITS
jgi:two-component system phosphate regulon sensor histidine kinase PhoR